MLVIAFFKIADAEGGDTGYTRMRFLGAAGL
jgi:hypothetical protein